MRKRRSVAKFLAAAWMAAAALAVVPRCRAQEPFRRWAFVGPQCIITAEASGARQFILNFINLSDFVIVIPASDFICKGASGQFYIGQVFDQQTKTTRGEVYRYSASVLINEHTFKGLKVVGAFREQDQIQELSVRIGSKRYYPSGLDKGQFEKLQADIEELDMRNTDGAAALRSVGLTELGGIKTWDGVTEWDRDWQTQLRPDGINPPRYLETPAVMPTDSARKNNIYGAVKLSATITRDGLIVNLAVVSGLGHGLDERAMEAVKASWVFLPATQNGEVIETKVQFEVPFPPPKK
jgi:TonB family protein